MLNVLESGAVMLIHRKNCSSETCISVRGHFEEYFYDENGILTDTVDMVPGGGALTAAYVVFMRKYYHLHEEYLASLKR